MIIIIIIAIRHSLSVLICSTKVDHVILSLFPITPVPPSVLSSLYRRFTLFHFQRFFGLYFLFIFVVVGLDGRHCCVAGNQPCDIKKKQFKEQCVSTIEIMKY